MKSIFYVLLLGVVSCTKPKLFKNNDLEKENLKGKVKSTYIEERFVKKKIIHCSGGYKDSYDVVYEISK